MYLFKNRDQGYIKAAVSNRFLCERPLAQQVGRLAGAVDLLILREKDLPDEEYRLLAAEVQSACRQYGLPLSVNGRITAAQELGITNIHLPFAQFQEHHPVLSAFAMVGVSIHSVTEAVYAASHGADYVIAGHIFATDCKKGIEPRGTDFLREVCTACTVPVLAIGGINDSNIQKVLTCGAAGACRMSGYMKL